MTEEFLIIPVGFNKFEEIIKTIPYNFNLLVIPFDYGLRTIRDLRQIHIPLLNRMRKKALDVIHKYIKNYDISNLHCEFHYTPSTYHLHLHIGLGKEIEGTRKHIIHKFEDVILNLNFDSEYYTKPILINVRNISEWKLELKKYSEMNIENYKIKSDSSTL